MAINIAGTDSRFLSYINAAQERLVTRGHWWGTFSRYNVSVTKQLLTLPPQFATIEQVAVCQVPITLRNLWYEQNPNGFGVLNDPTATATNSGTSQAMFRGTYPSFIDITSGNKARLQCDVLGDVGATVLLLGFDSSGNWVRTVQGGNLADGEVVTLAQSPGTLSTTLWSKITDIQKPVTKGQVWLYDWDGSANTLIGTYQYFETSPSYSRYLLPTIPGTATQIDLIGKLAFIPVVNDTDYLIIGNLEALRLAAMACKLEEEYKYADAAILMNGKRDPISGKAIVEGAITILEDELQHYQGSGVVPVMNVQYGPTNEAVEVVV
jgi:hypothetical protein